jgi:hypothetical protein
MSRKPRYVSNPLLPGYALAVTSLGARVTYSQLFGTASDFGQPQYPNGVPEMLSSTGPLVGFPGQPKASKPKKKKAKKAKAQRPVKRAFFDTP